MRKRRKVSKSGEKKKREKKGLLRNFHETRTFFHVEEKRGGIVQALSSG